MNNQSVNIERRMNFNAELINKFGISFWLQIGLLGSLVWSIEASGWVDSPPLFIFIFLLSKKPYILDFTFVIGILSLTSLGFT